MNNGHIQLFSRSYGKWQVECLPADGARLSRLAYAGKDLLSAAPRAFSPPRQDFGDYERRPVYGYDDCFPTVDACVYPGSGWQVPDHGELCWLPWTVSEHDGRLCCSVESRVMPLSFRREMVFGDSCLDWVFSVSNKGGTPAVFQHVMHPLMPLINIKSIRLPDFSGCIQAAPSGRSSISMDADEAARLLLDSPDGHALMWFLQDVKTGRFGLELNTGISLNVTYDRDLFPALGIWWNRNGYPAEEGCRRNECAFEPVPGIESELASAVRAGGGMRVASGGNMTWTVKWEVACR